MKLFFVLLSSPDLSCSAVCGGGADFGAQKIRGLKEVVGVGKTMAGMRVCIGYSGERRVGGGPEGEREVRPFPSLVNATRVEFF